MSLLSLVGIAVAFFVGGAWVAGALLFPLFNAAVARWPRLARGSLRVAAVPALVGAALALAAFLPGDPHLDSLIGCHCDTSMPGWVHLCPVHPTTAPSVVLPALAVLALLGPGRARAIGALLREPLGTGTGATPTVVDLPRPTALLAGWWRPSLLIDRRLWRGLAPGHRAALLAHERAHLARRDPLVLAMLRLATALGPAESGRRLVRQWLDHAERSADAAAAGDVDPLTIAEALVACARLGAPAPTLQLGWTAGSLDGRVRALVELGPGAHAARPDAGATDLGLVGLAVGAGLASVPWLHHQVEHLLNLAF